MTKSEMALEFHKKGFNCAQSVALPFADELGLDPTTLSKTLEGFGAGMGGFSLTCGALSAAVYIAGVKYADGNLNAPASKRNTYSVCKKLGEEFKLECGSAICGEIKGLSGGKPLKSCNDCILCGVKLTEN
ncbi:MAG: C_GCAxxG_C_C family protein, partial [Clostridia bacterium]|nr:C_GCAxxG_C_C family protein [Clostridia bacterium]